MDWFKARNGDIPIMRKDRNSCDHGEERDHRRDRQRSRDRPKPGIVANIDQVRGQFSFGVGRIFALQHSRELSYFIDKSLGFGRIGNLACDCQPFRPVEFVQSEGCQFRIINVHLVR